MVNKALLLALLIILTSCTPQGQSCENREDYQYLYHLAKSKSSAEKDAQMAWAKGDSRLLGLYGFTVDVPGVTGVADSNVEALVVRKYGVRMIGGTSDTPCDINIHNGVHEYAELYNSYLIKELKMFNK